MLGNILQSPILVWLPTTACLCEVWIGTMLVLSQTEYAGQHMFHVCILIFTSNLTPSLLVEKAAFLILPTVYSGNHLEDSLKVASQQKLMKY